MHDRRKEGLEKPFVILLLAVLTVVVTVTISFWMGGLTSVFTKREQIEIPSAYASKNEEGGWIITVKLKNTGSIDATLDLLLINGKGYSEFESDAIVITPSLPLTVQAGSERIVEITVKAGTSGFMTGTTIDMVFRSASGRTYPKPVMIT